MTSNSSERYALLGRLAEEFAARYRRGERPSLQEYMDRYPDLAHDIREFFPAMAKMEQVKQEQGQASDGAAPAPALRQLGDYRIIREVGKGGMGIVYEAEQVSLGRHVALKVLPKSLLPDAKAKRRFDREAKAAARLHHTNIVPVFGTGEQEGTSYYVMQFIQGTGLDVVIAELSNMIAEETPASSPAVADRDLSAIARSLLTGSYRPAPDAAQDLTRVEEARPQEEEGPWKREVPPSATVASTGSRSAAAPDWPSSTSGIKLPGLSDSSSGSSARRPSYWQSVARVGVQVADALAYAHKQGIVHRDVKPSNLLLDLAGTVWITDFGLAKADDQQNLTHAGDIVGTLRYMPPEAFEGRGDARGDVYSLGLTLYELATLRPAFPERDRKKLMKQLAATDAAPMRRVRLGVPRDLETIIHKAIEREPERRYQQAEDLAEDLRRFLEDRPIKARRASGVERVARWARRNPVVAASLVVVVAIFLTAFALVSWSYWRAEDALKDEAAQRKAAERAREDAQRNEKSERWERYRASMIAAGSAMQLHNVTAAQSALDAAPEEYRNWEWQYFSHQLDTAQHVIRFGDDIRAMGISPDGTMAVVQSASGPARLWSLGTRREIGALANLSPATRFWFSPDNKILASEHGENLMLWDVPSGGERAVVRVPGGRKSEVRFSPDGARLAVGSTDKNVYVWDTTAGKRLLTLRGHQEDVPDVSFSPDGRRIASAGDLDRTVRLWDSQTGQSQAILTPHDGPIHQAVFSPQGDRVLTVEAYPGNSLRLWDAATGKLRSPVMRGHTNAAEHVAFSSDGERIASGGLDRTVRIWDGHTGQALWSREGHRGAISSLAFSPDGKYVLSASHDQTARLWDAATGTPLGVLHGHTGLILDTSARYSAGGQTIVTASVADGTVRLWDARRAEWNSSLRGSKSFVYSVAFHPDGKRVASAGWEGTVRIWDATTGRQLTPLHYPFPQATEFKVVSSVAFHPGGKLVAAFGRDGAVRFWDLEAAEEKFHFQLPPENVYSSDSRMAFSSQGNLLAASGGSDNSVRLWDVERRAEIAVLKGHSSWVLEACFSPDDSWLATAAYDRTVRIWDVAKREQIHLLEGHTDEVQCLAVSRDGKWLASGCRDGRVRLWDTTTWKKIDELKHGTIVYGVAFSPDGTRLAAACANNMIRFWDMRTFQLVAELVGHDDYVHQIAFSPDGTRLVSGSGDLTVRIWDSLSVQERAKRDASPSRPDNPE